MCGIAGILKFDSRARVEEGRLVAMHDKLVHRGPDGAGVVVQGHVGLAHRRLSIIDLAGGHQPMANASKDVWLTYNGEIYNFKELRTQLKKLGASFTTHSDTEVILHAYEIYGDACVEHLRGMFAFAIWDGRKQRLLLVRDRLGIKPLYYSRNDEQLLFASEIKAVLAGSDGAPTFNRDVLPEFLASRFIAGESTFFAGVDKLLPGHLLTWHADSGVTIRRYWRPGRVQDEAGRTREDYVRDVRQQLESAVRRHLVSDVPVGLFLSGGLDSSALAGLMAPMMSEPLQTFSVGFSERAANELEFARLAAHRVGARHREVVVTPEQFFAHLPKLIWHEDEPIAFTSSVPLNIVSKLASQEVKVVLTGEGADELFLGYDYRYRVTALNAQLAAYYQKLVPSPLRKAVAASVPALPRKLRRYVQRSFLALDNSPRALFFENFSVFNHKQRAQLLKQHDQGREEALFAQGLAYFDAGGDEFLSCMSHADLQTYMVELLMKQDQMSMAASIESRVPFLDDTLVEFVTSIPTRHRLRHGRTKALLRDAVKDVVPEAILKRGKMGFPVPLGEWLRGPYWSLVEAFVLDSRAVQRGLFDPAALKTLAHEHRVGAADHAERLWLLINLEMWQRLFIDGDEYNSLYSGRLPWARKDLAAHSSILAASC
jgi:asparagine synthase (glutamine-hydrolysing)